MIKKSSKKYRYILYKQQTKYKKNIDIKNKIT